jgi:D-alanyl-D-alanine carboxypeptidase/D-alanyl-D-alanine-endopeptidase (penicillin-binding protein 4)
VSTPKLAIALAALALVPAAPRAAPKPREVESALRAIVEGSALAGARVGVLALSLDDGRTVFAKDPDALFNPASNVKLFTSAAALARLGPDYRFETEFLVDAASRGRGSVRALYVRGKGDPTLVTERLWAIAGDLAHLGIRRVGDLVLDDGWFDGERLGPGFDQEDGDRSYLAPTGALSLNFNSVAIHVAPGARRGDRGRVELEPASSYFEVENRVVTAGPRATRQLVASSQPGNGRQRIVVSGRVPQGGRPQVFWRKIDDPPAYLGHTLRRLLELRGVVVTGRIRAGEVPPDARLAHVSESEPLGDVVRKLNKTSNNFVAEQILKTLGAEARGAPGSWAKGIDATEEFLAQIGIPRGSYVMRNGSGLNDANRFSARQTVTLLRAMRGRSTVWPEFLTSLPVAGRDGTIRWRMEGTEAVGRVRAKTGTLGNVASLSGYVETAAGEPIAFAILVNDYPGRSSPVVRAVDALASALAASGGAAAELSAAVALASPPAAAPGAPADAGSVAALVRTYYELGREGDRRNLPFLRGALRTETEPAVRMAVGECVYLSDPDGDASRRAFLDAIDPAALADLHAAAASPDVSEPVVGSLSEIAAEGSPDGIGRLLDLAAPAAAAGEPLGDSVADALAEVAASVPDEVLAGLAAYGGPVDAAVRALARGLARSGDPDHAFAAALAAAAAGEGDLAPVARDLVGRLREAEAAERAPRMGPASADDPASADGAQGARSGG